MSNTKEAWPQGESDKCTLQVTLGTGGDDSDTGCKSPHGSAEGCCIHSRVLMIPVADCGCHGVLLMAISVASIATQIGGLDMAVSSGVVGVA